MAVTSDAKRRDDQPRERLLVGHSMMCPRCKKRNDVLRFVPMGIIEEFRTETNPIYKCPECRWVFSPALSMQELKLMFGIDSESETRSEN